MNAIIINGMYLLPLPEGTPLGVVTGAALGLVVGVVPAGNEIGRPWTGVEVRVVHLRQK